MLRSIWVDHRALPLKENLNGPCMLTNGQCKFSSRQAPAAGNLAIIDGMG